MKIGIITPIGPGHETSYESCKQSIEIAWQFNKGPFTDLEIIAMPDPHGHEGRQEWRDGQAALRHDQVQTVPQQRAGQEALRGER